MFTACSSLDALIERRRSLDDRRSTVAPVPLIGRPPPQPPNLHMQGGQDVRRPGGQEAGALSYLSSWKEDRRPPSEEDKIRENRRNPTPSGL